MFFVLVYVLMVFYNLFFKDNFNPFALERFPSIQDSNDYEKKKKMAISSLLYFILTLCCIIEILYQKYFRIFKIIIDCIIILFKNILYVAVLSCCSVIHLTYCMLIFLFLFIFLILLILLISSLLKFSNYLCNLCSLFWFTY